jgi:hypothetical protein
LRAADVGAHGRLRRPDVTARQTLAEQGPVALPREGGVTLLALVLIASPLLQWLYLTGLSYFTLLEPPFTTSRGVVLALQLFFDPGNVLAVAIGVGLLRRSQWARRVGLLLFLLGAAAAALQIGTQVAARRFDSSVLLAGSTLVFCAVYLWYFARRGVKQQFQQPPQAGVEVAVAMPAPKTRSRAVVICAWIEIVLGCLAAALLWHLYGVFGTAPLLNMGEGPSVEDADQIVKLFLFVCLALLMAPHALTAAGSIGIVFGSATTSLVRRYSIIAAWSMIGAMLITAWLVVREGLAFDTRSSDLLFAFCGFSFVWHLFYLYVLASARSAPPAGSDSGDTAR